MMNEKECRDALNYLYAPLANTMVLEMSYDLLINLIDEYFKPKENTLDFKHFNLRSDSVLKNMNKDELIEYIHMLYHNWSVADERSENIKKYAEKLQEKETPKKVELMRIKKYDGYDIGICDCGTILDTSLIDKINYCPSCGKRIDWSDEE